MTAKQFIEKNTENCRPKSLGVFDSEEEIAYDNGYNYGYESGFQDGFEKAVNLL